MAEDKNGICRLCLKHSILRNSHILPEFLYSEVYDEKHRGFLISQEKDKVFQKGIREYLLCQECETKLSRYEKYAKDIIEKIPKLPSDPDKKFLFLENVNYIYFKLFQLSLLWRASISTHKAFKQIDLGPHAEIIRNMIEKEDPGKTSKYGCVMSIILNTELLHKLIQSPTKFTKKFFGHNAYKFVTGNLTWVFIVSSHEVTSNIKKILLQEDGLLKVLLSPYDEKSELIKVAKTFQRLSKNRKAFNKF